MKYESSIITSKIPSKILSNENKRTGVSRKIACFGILIHVLSLTLIGMTLKVTLKHEAGVKVPNQPAL